MGLRTPESIDRNQLMLLAFVWCWDFSPSVISSHRGTRRDLRRCVNQVRHSREHARMAELVYARTSQIRAGNGMPVRIRLRACLTSGFDSARYVPYSFHCEVRVGFGRTAKPANPFGSRALCICSARCGASSGRDVASGVRPRRVGRSFTFPQSLGRILSVKLKPDSIQTHLLHLPADERARLAELLLASLDTADSDSIDAGNQPELDAAWASEVDRRYADLRSGAVAGIPADQVYAEIRAELQASRSER
jgi:putative addiction module component (TIGR02574 family)